jgi:uncharacterized protein YbaR (Trm112 family)
MSAAPNDLPQFDSSIVDRLACPACLGQLRFAEARLICLACSRAYPIVEGIPVLIADPAAPRHSVSRVNSSTSEPTLHTE